MQENQLVFFCNKLIQKGVLYSPRSHVAYPTISLQTMYNLDYYRVTYTPDKLRFSHEQHFSVVSLSCQIMTDSCDQVLKGCHI